MIYLDTNIVIWLAGAKDQLSEEVINIINNSDALYISPMVRLEIQYLYEIGRISQPAQVLLNHLKAVLNLQTCQRSFASIVKQATLLNWTRDPFDRLITAQAALGDDQLLTRDNTIRSNYVHAKW